MARNGNFASRESGGGGRGGGETTLRLQNLVIKQHGNKKRDKKRKLE